MSEVADDVANAAKPPPLACEITFQYTFEELREGLRPPEQAAKRIKPAIGLLGWFLFVAFAVALYVLLQSRSASPLLGAGMPPPPPPEPAPPRVDLWLTLMPSALAAVIVGVLISAGLVSVRLSRSSSPATRRRGGTAMAVAIVTCALLIWAGLSIVSDSRTPTDWQPSRVILIVLSLAPWVVVLIGLIWIVRRAVRRQWATRPSLRRQRTIGLDDQGLHNRDELTTLLYRWPYYRRAWETENLLVLADENDHRHILPKRAFAGDDQLEVARAIVASHVEDSKFRVQPRGFAMTPIAVLPLESARADGR